MDIPGNLYKTSRIFLWFLYLPGPSLLHMWLPLSIIISKLLNSNLYDIHVLQIDLLHQDL